MNNDRVNIMHHAIFSQMSPDSNIYEFSWTPVPWLYLFEFMSHDDAKRDVVLEIQQFCNIHFDTFCDI